MKSENIMRKLLFIAGCTALICAANVNDSQAASATSNSTGIVVTPIAISKQVDLNFGKFMSGASLGTVAVSTSDVQTPGGGVTSTTNLAASAKAAKFQVSGEPSATYALSLPGSPITMTGPGGATMTVDTFTSVVDVGTLNAGVGTLPASGPQVLTVGATAHVAASQASGSYTGTFDVSVDYN